MKINFWVNVFWTGGLKSLNNEWACLRAYPFEVLCCTEIPASHNYAKIDFLFKLLEGIQEKDM